MIYRDRRTIYIPTTNQPDSTYQATTYPSINLAKKQSRLLGGSRGLVRVGKPPRNVAEVNPVAKETASG